MVILKCICKYQGPRIVLTIVKENNKVGENYIIFPLKIYTNQNCVVLLEDIGTETNETKSFREQ
jgi:hypothetical protein